MRRLLFLLFLTSVSFATEYELSYENGLWATTYGVGGASQQNLRVRFTPTSQVIGLHLSKGKVYWHQAGSGTDLHFHFNVYEPDSGFSVNSQGFVVSNQTQWLIYDISSINYIGSTSDFYLAVISESGGSVGISGCNQPPIDQRSAWQTLTQPNWVTITNYDLCLRAIFDDTVGVEPTSLGNIRALYR